MATSLFEVAVRRAERLEHADDLERRAVVGDGLADGVRRCRTARWRCPGRARRRWPRSASSASVRKRPAVTLAGADVLPARRGARERRRPVRRCRATSDDRGGRTRRPRPGCRARRRWTASAAASLHASASTTMPKPPRTPVLARWCCPGETTSRLVPSSLICRGPRPWRPGRADGEHDGGDADEDAEHRERRAQPVRAHRLAGGAEGVAPVHGRSLRHDGLDAAVADLDRCGSARAATSCSWVMSTIVRPASWRSSSRSRTSAVDVESRLPVGSSARIMRRLGDERPGDGDALLLAARQLARAVVGPVGQPDRVEGREGPAPSLGGRTPAYTSGSSTLRHAGR